MKEKNIRNDFFESTDALQGFYPMDDELLDKVHGGGFDTDFTGIWDILTDDDLLD
ncbi:hypothetical protein [Mucilaginibacter polytrichastri]|uniref:Uncharacterized protein n=1 Tax=Mucilaginibacter polytrichastri TaxID=1302689 RepID=A0A1Q6A074_9SPHI|nr:hypothetical protein [Mucilaginibacter polytrichastri]OKS87419.1 hypothetical protein RG47T_2880 [Mucilaginibacter polytrichastri]SFS90402.1 hypothetical protein SAMN04487890_10616 [Mucilaginibacter polytrichastri]